MRASRSVDCFVMPQTALAEIMENSQQQYASPSAQELPGCGEHLPAFSTEKPHQDHKFFEVRPSNNSKDLLSLVDWSKQDYLALFARTKELAQIAGARSACNTLQGQQLVSAFYERSSRTRLSFESAMNRMGGKVLGQASPQVTHAGDDYKESLADLLQMLQGYADVIVVRHPETGILSDITSNLSATVVNCGDGMGEHPTQLLIDAYTLLQHFGTLERLKITCVGDMRMRVFHSLFCVAATFDWKLDLCLPPHSEIPETWRNFLDTNKLAYEIHDSLATALEQADAVYVDAVMPHEHSLGHFGTEAYKQQIINDFQLRPSILEQFAPTDVVVLHPLPRGPELPHSLDKTKYNLYWNEAANGVPLRMAVLEQLLLGK